MQLEGTFDGRASAISAHQLRSRWIAAAELGLISSTFSTVVSQLSAARIGRDAWVDWMTVAAIPARDWALSAEPSWSAVLAGIAFHQWADFSWAMVFFGVLGRWTAQLRPLAILLLALLWAIFSSATEWLLLVPLIPFWQPLFTLQQPYWIGLLVHGASALMYPLFAWLRWAPGCAPNRDVRVAKIWTAVSLAVILLLGAIALLSVVGRELPWMGQDKDADQTYIRHMTTHHAQGIELASLGAGRARDPHLRALANLMIASQSGENRIFESWWQSWFKAPMPDCTADERAAMPGYLTPAQMQQVKAAAEEQFDAQFTALMTLHHKGAVRMADLAWRGRGDFRLRIMAHAIRHEQQGQIALMERIEGTAAVATALRNMFADNVN
ncbi:DUF305 domain-containing protein [Bradyrhizobium sp. WSM 1738]|uniref:DUF305 domain-containing protein n=1 Tax=Bradyrhizobium hereditatis TaxID=2821405 RepID=UPI001CE366D2|nr:DUF305 domain-containing protein [Bradyrhizobium hereditatis]MCA6119221.1 DUF305 domain-containing protein [Bradyrhizobium hereditatis]